MNHTRQMASKNNTPLFWIMCILAVVWASGFLSGDETPAVHDPEFAQGDD